MLMSKLKFIVFFLGIIHANINLNLESQYGSGSNVNDQTQDTTSYYNFENLFDIKVNYRNLN